jgi:hypothetical protein
MTVSGSSGMRRNFAAVWALQGFAMYRWVYWGGVAVCVVWIALSAYSVFKGF